MQISVFTIMKKIFTRQTQQQKLLTTMQMPKQSAKKVSKNSKKKRYAAKDLIGLSWTLFSEDY